MSNDGEHTVGFIDLGTNSARLLVVRSHPDRAYSELNRLKEVVRLGEGEFITNVLQPQAMHRAALVCRKFVEMSHGYDVENIVAVATSASRDARNKDVFLKRLRREAGLDVRIISGKEEARLIYLGVSSGLKLGDEKALFIDIGGGSTEIVVGDQQEYFFLDSLNLGAIRLYTKFFSPVETGPVTPRRYKKIQRHVRQSSVRTIQQVKSLKFSRAVGSSGTLINLAEIAAKLCHPGGGGSVDVLTRADLKLVVTHLCALSVEERAKVPGINPERADIIIPGAAIIDTLMEDLNLAEIRISDRGLREGMPIDYLSGSGNSEWMDHRTFRKRSVLQLGHSCSFEEAHAKHVAELALQLFDSSSAVGLHTLGETERELLEYAALLHDVGIFLSYRRHRAHSYYLIRNAELLGFDETEIAVMAVTVLYHHKSYPRRKHPQFAELDKRHRRVVRILCVLLRLAESLDRTHGHVVKQVELRPIGGKACLLDVTADVDCQLEIGDVQNHAWSFKKTFKKRLRFSVNGVEIEEPTATDPQLVSG